MASAELSATRCAHVAAAVLALGTAGCYQRRPLDAREVLAQLRADEGDLNRVAGAGEKSDAGAASAPLSEAGAVALALLRNPELRALRQERGVAEGQVIAAGALANPELRLELTHLQSGANLGWGIGLAWQPPQPVMRSARRAAADAHREEVERAIAAREWEVAADVRGAFAVLAGAEAAVQLSGAAVAVRTRLAEAVNTRLGRGAATRLDADLIALALGDAERARGEADLARQQAARGLARLLGVSPDQALRIETVGAVDPASVGAFVPATCLALQQRAVETRAGVGASIARYRASDEMARFEHARRWPWFRFSAIPRLRRNEFFGNESDYVLGIELTLPVFDWNTGAIRAAEAARDRAAAELVWRVDGVRREVADACADLEARASLLRLERERIAPVLEQHDRLLGQALQAHEVDLTSIIVGEGRVLESRLALARAEVAVKLARVALDRALGASYRDGEALQSQ